jgi:hypothetical protein
MPTSYHAVCPDRGGLASASLDGLAEFLRKIPWPAGTYRVIQHTWPAISPGAPDREWGSAVKHPDGTVELIEDRSP